MSYTYLPANFPVLYTYYEPPAGHYVYIKSVVDFAGNVLVATNTKKFIPPPPPPKPPKGFWNYLSLNNIIQSIKDFVEAVIKIVDFASNFYNGLKAGLTNLIAEGLSSIGIPCEATCKSVISSGLSIGQAALGIPPSIPNFDQLMDEGVDYLAKEAASQVSSATGLPLDEAAEYAVKASLKKTIKEVKEANTENKKNSLLFIIPDPDFQYKPGQFKIVLKNTGNDIGGGYLKVTFTENSSLIKTDLKNGRNFYSPIVINVPPLKKNETLTIPIILEENYKDYASANGDIDPSYICTGSCVGIVNTPEYAAAARWSRWMEVYKKDKITMTITTGVGMGLPFGFDPKNYGFDTSKWKKISKDTWKDEKGVLHIFRPKENKDLKQNQTIIKTIDAGSKYQQNGCNPLLSDCKN